MPYQLDQPKPLALTVLEQCSHFVRFVVPVGATAAAAAGLWVSATAYGCLAMRLFLGKYAARRALAGRWPWHFWVDIPLIPFMLVASRLPILANFSTWLPTLVALPVTSAPLPMRRAMLYRYSAQAAFPRTYPPSPVLTTLLLPWLRVLYIAVKRQVYRYVLSSPRRPRNRPAQDEGRREPPPTRMVIVGNDTEGAMLVDGVPDRAEEDTYETLDDGSLVHQDGWEAEQGLPLDELEYRVFDETELPGTIYVTYYSLSKLLVQSLGFPFIASFMGGILGAASKYSDTLRSILGIAPGISPQPGCESWISLLWPKDREGEMPMVVSGSEPLWVDDMGAVYDDLDPVWYRNAIGGALYLVVKDCLVLLYRYLNKKQRGQQRIKDFPFSEGVAKELLAARP